jgi:hypothetical protein
VGLLVKGGKTGTDDIQTRAKESVRSILVGAGFNQFEDHHVWHPTYVELCELITSTGFSVEKTHWQESQNDQVCYIRSIKRT